MCVIIAAAALFKSWHFEVSVSRLHPLFTCATEAEISTTASLCCCSPCHLYQLIHFSNFTERSRPLKLA